MIIQAQPGCWYGKFMTLEEVIEAWNSGKDFQERESKSYLSKRDIEFLKKDGIDGIYAPGYGLVATF